MLNVALPMSFVFDNVVSSIAIRFCQSLLDFVDRFCGAISLIAFVDRVP